MLFPHMPSPHMPMQVRLSGHERLRLLRQQSLRMPRPPRAFTPPTPTTIAASATSAASAAVVLQCEVQGPDVRLLAEQEDVVSG